MRSAASPSLVSSERRAIEYASMVRVGLVGCGTIGSRLALALQRNYADVARVIALYDINPSHALALQQRLTNAPPITPLSTLIRRSHLVIEAASAHAASRLIKQALRANRSVLIMSVGGLLGSARWQTLAHRSTGRVYIPSGALVGLDGVKAMAIGRIRRASLTTRKPPRALFSAPYVRRRGLRLNRLTKPRVIFDGSPRAAVAAFPQNTNIAAALTLAMQSSAQPAGRSAARAPVRIRVIADPTIRVNRHELVVVSDCGRFECQVESVPSANPKTSELAVRSAIATLGRIFRPIAVGT